MSDAHRFNLVTSFACTACGSKLELSYTTPKVTPYEPEKTDGITGALKVEKVIGIHPCRKCTAELQAPLIALRQALGIKEK